VTEYIMQMSLGPTYGACVAAGHRRDHHLRAADRQRAHALCRHRGAARAAGRDDAAEVAPGLQERLERERHRGGRGATVAVEDCRFSARVVACHFARVHAGGRGLARGRQIDRDHAQAQPVEALAQEEQLAAFGVEGAGDVRGAKRCSRRPGSRTPAVPGSQAARRALRWVRSPGAVRAMSAAGELVPPAFQRVKPRTVLGAMSASVGAPSPWARRTVSTWTVAGASRSVDGVDSSRASSAPP
jgi:hypothetical protein